MTVHLANANCCSSVCGEASTVNNVHGGDWTTELVITAGMDKRKKFFY